MAAESYTRLSGRLAALNVTTGPGGINALNGVHGAYTDSIGMIILSGQVKRETLRSNAPGLRQLGDQEADIVAMVTPITKFAALVDDPAEIRFLLEKALWLAEYGRPGPVWLDIPIDVQSAMVDPETLRGFDPATEDDGRPSREELRVPARQVIAMLREARRPVLLPGNGCPYRRRARPVSRSRRAARHRRRPGLECAGRRCRRSSALCRPPGHRRRPCRQFRGPEVRLVAGPRLPPQRTPDQL